MNDNDSNLEFILRREMRAREAYEKAKSPPFNDGIMAGVIEYGPDNCWSVAVLRTLRDERPIARQFAVLGGQLSMEALFGAWRPLEMAWNRETQQFEPWGSEDVARERHAGWIPAFRDGLACACAIGDYAAASRIAEYTIGPRLRHNLNTGPEWEPEAVDAYEAYSDLLLKRPFRLKDDGSKAKACRKRSMLLKRCLHQIHAQDWSRAWQSLDEFVIYYDRYERDKTDKLPVRAMSQDATVLDYLIRQLSGDSFPEVPKCVLRL